MSTIRKFLLFVFTNTWSGRLDEIWQSVSIVCNGSSCWNQFSFSLSSYLSILNI